MEPEAPLLVLHTADAEGEWSKRTVRAEFHSDNLILHGVGDDLDAVAIDAGSVPLSIDRLYACAANNLARLYRFRLDQRIQPQRSAAVDSHAH
ncbi:MAG: hypothetical protein FJX20_09615 [Alphaproteobacteria bacterium]|nr:hypothetical protein [Alphaproteobacteria bacterium]